MSEWRPVAGFEGYYEVSSEGNIRRVLGGSGAKLGKFLKGKTGNSGYHEVCLAKEGKHYWRLAHRLVAEAFLGSSSLHVNHKNCDKLDNRVENLEYVTRSENMQHAVANGRDRWATRTFDADAVKRDDRGRFAA